MVGFVVPVLADNPLAYSYLCPVSLQACRPCCLGIPLELGSSFVGAVKKRSPLSKSKRPPEGSQIIPTLFGICVAELIPELQEKALEFVEIQSIDDLNWIGAFLYVDDMVLIARSPSQLQDMLDVCQDEAKRSCMTINHDKKEVMMFYETPLQKASRQTASF